MITLVLIVVGYGAMFGAFIWALILLAENKGSPRKSVGGVGFLAGCALLFSNPMSLRRVSEAYDIGGVWSSHYVMHIPVASDFSTFAGRFFTSWFQLSQHTPMGVLAFIGFSYGILICLTTIAKEKTKGLQVKDELHELAIAFGIAFSGFFVLAFLAPYILATLMFLTDWWWAVLLFLLMGLGGGGTRVYNREGRHVGTFYD